MVASAATLHPPGPSTAPQLTVVNQSAVQTTRVLTEEGPGYVAQAFEDKEKQMQLGECGLEPVYPVW